MDRSNNKTTVNIFIKNMVCNCCMEVVANLFEKHKITVLDIKAGEARIEFDKNVITLKEIDRILTARGFGLIHSRDLQIVEKIKNTVIDLIHNMNNVDSVVRKSEYLVEMLGMNYRYLSKIFSKYENITLERFIILNKMERIKELIRQDEYTLSEIAYMMDYSSVQYLSNQFKKETGYSVTEYKRLGLNLSIPIDEILNSKKEG